jgi:phosphoribosyl 1,2-cyclic phosphodiesterase
VHVRDELGYEIAAAWLYRQRLLSADELRQLQSGTPLAVLADHYLSSQEFRDFYFHRIRLYLESQGTELQDEPARLWCYVAFHDLPFQGILTADYTVDREFKQQPRPEDHGHTGVLTTKGFIEGKPGLPHYNYAAQVSMLFLGYVYEVPPEVVETVRGTEAVVLDALRERPHPTHMSLDQALAVVARLAPERAFFTHMCHDLPHAATCARLPAGVELAYDGLTFEIDL